MSQPVEKLRTIWTPERELEEYFSDLSPQTRLDSQVRDFLHRVIQQKGPVTLDLGVLNAGTLRWEVVHHEPVPGMVGRHEVSLWID